ncbi:protein NRT1/ PTR FAMILY 5.2-like isoform X2 [Magnolia sinica]|uniref:protein NRT1/ PTR FAMILY 5.2-like isoform X2 n=1 Tax=Magnolia sinica TaxID=86752 RepID=UPI002659563C|nr:protein NRT1/ PTR FAMILY 5.2-like isoform X2 [Magnolia sinica]
MAVVEEKGVRDGLDDFTQDGSVDLKGQPILRSKGGRWTACSFILQEGTVTASNNVTNWVGTVWMTPILGAYIADAHLGRYWTFVIASCIYLAGMSLLTLAVSIPWLKPPHCNGPCEPISTYKAVVFYFALYTIAVGTGGTKPNISTMGADQFDDFEPRERVQKLSFFNWWMFSIFFGTLFSNTFLVYIQDNVGWALGYGLPTFGLALSLLVFLVGTPFYRHKLPSGSPFTKMARVLVAALRKSKVPVPTNPKELHELGLEEYAKAGKFRIDYTPSLRFLDKAAVKTGLATPWMLCSVTQVEETKQMIKMLPILIVTFIPSTMIAQVHTLFIKQGTTLDRHMGPKFEIPPASLTAFVTIFMLISIVIYDRYFVPAIRKYTHNPRGITLLQRMGIGLVMHVIILTIAAIFERKRLEVARNHGITQPKGVVPLTIFILLPQFALTGIADAFVEVAKIEFFYDQAPQGMKSLGTSYFTTSLGIGNFLSSFLLTTVTDITKRNGGNGWVQNNLNISHLDYYYTFLAVITALNLVCFVVVAKSYSYSVDIIESKIELQDSGLPNKAGIEENASMEDDGNSRKNLL